MNNNCAEREWFHKTTGYFNSGKDSVPRVASWN
jgi:hypothetical protein